MVINKTTNLHPCNTKVYTLQLVINHPLIHHVVPHNGSRIDVLSQPRGSFHTDKLNKFFFFQILIRFINLKSLLFCDLLCYFHMRSEIIQIVTCDFMMVFNTSASHFHEYSFHYILKII